VQKGKAVKTASQFAMNGRSKRRLVALAVGLIASVAGADQPNEEEWELLEQGRAHFDAGRYADAAEAFERADMLIPTTDSITNAATAYVYAGQCADAVTVLQRLLDRSPEIRSDDGVRRVTLAIARERDAPDWRRCSLAMRWIRAVDMSLNLAVAADAPEQDARDFARLGESHYDAGWYAFAALFFELSYDCYPIGDALHNAAMAYHQAGQHQQALDAFRRFVARGSNQLRGSASVAAVLQEASSSGELSEADVCLLVSRVRRAIATETGDTVTDMGEARRLWDLAIATYQAGEYHQAAVLFECVQLVAGHPTVLLNAARSYAADHDWVSARRAYDRYLAARPEVAADPAVARARQAVEQEPYATDDRGSTLFNRLNWAVERAADQLDDSTGGSP
jgi:tetratricopeptide (TPR) repeat protein